MKLQFNLEYHTTFGEELVLNILSDKKVEQHKMSTLDGLHWSCELNKSMKAGVYMDYYSNNIFCYERYSRRSFQ